MFILSYLISCLIGSFPLHFSYRCFPIVFSHVVLSHFIPPSPLLSMHQQFAGYKEQVRRTAQEPQQRQQGQHKDDAPTCGICHKTKFADGCGNICSYCQTKFCARCGGRVSLRSNSVSVLGFLLVLLLDGAQMCYLLISDCYVNLCIRHSNIFHLQTARHISVCLSKLCFCLLTCF